MDASPGGRFLSVLASLGPAGTRGTFIAWPGAAPGLARREKDRSQPAGHQDEHDHGQDENRRERHGRTRVSHKPPFPELLAADAPGCNQSHSLDQPRVRPVA